MDRNNVRLAKCLLVSRTGRIQWALGEMSESRTGTTRSAKPSNAADVVTEMSKSPYNCLQRRYGTIAACTRL